MNMKMTALAVLLAVGFVVAGGLASTPIVIGPVPNPYIDPALEDEWDEDAANWQQPGDFATVPDSDKPLANTSYILFGYLQSEDDWDEDASNWQHPDDFVTVPDSERAIAETDCLAYGYVQDEGDSDKPVTKTRLHVFGNLHNEDDWDEDASNWEHPNW